MFHSNLQLLLQIVNDNQTSPEPGSRCIEVQPMAKRPQACLRAYARYGLVTEDPRGPGQFGAHGHLKNYGVGWHMEI